MFFNSAEGSPNFPGPSPYLVPLRLEEGDDPKKSKHYTQRLFLLQENKTASHVKKFEDSKI